MSEELLSAQDSMALLRENAARLAALTAGVSAERLHRQPNPDEWSPNDVLAHIRACCDVWGGNIARILADDHPTFAGVNPRTWMRKTDYPDRTFAEGFGAFSSQREALLATLDALSPAEWERSAMVTSGFSTERTLRSYASQLAKHERTHVRQIERALNS